MLSILPTTILLEYSLPYMIKYELYHPLIYIAPPVYTKIKYIFFLLYFVSCVSLSATHILNCSVLTNIHSFPQHFPVQLPRLLTCFISWGPETISVFCFPFGFLAYAFCTLLCLILVKLVCVIIFCQLILLSFHCFKNVVFLDISFLFSPSHQSTTAPNFL